MGVQPHLEDVAPDLGIASRLNDKPVFRGGFGISFAPFPDNQYGWNNFPITQKNSFNPNNSYGPAVLPNGQIAQLSAGFPAPTLDVIPTNRIIPNAAHAAYNVIHKQLREPYVESWHLALH